MEKLRMETADMTEQNIDKIGRLFPNVITEFRGKDGKLKKAIYFDLLKQLLSDDVLEGDEAYEFSWVGKKASIIEANKPIRKTLRPCREESKNWDTTGNLYVEGENLDVLKLLQESYLGKIKIIYIDPPYNTGNDYIYIDNFTIDKENYDFDIGLFDENANHLFEINNKSKGRFHSDWCSMLYPRLKLALNLLSEDGAIFISIDDNEMANLKNMCNEIFGEKNYVAIFPWRKRTAKSDVPHGVSQDFEWIMCYAKSDSFTAGIESTGRKYYESPDLPNRPWRIHDMTKQTSASERPNSFFDMVDPKTGKSYSANANSVWRITKDTFKKYYKQNRIVFPDDYDFLNISNPVFRYFKDDDAIKDGNMFGFTSVSTNLPSEVGMTQNGTKNIAFLFKNKIFGFPKPVELLKHILKISMPIDKNAVVLDFFSGSATTAHAVMQLNAEDSGNRKFIMVQLEEECPKDSEAYKSGYKNICEIGKERIRRAGEKIKADAGILGHDLDIGFRVLKLDSTNMKDVYYAAKDYSQAQLSDLISNIKEDRTDMDILFACLLEWGLPLSLAHKTEKIDGFDVHTINDGDLMACFADEVSESVIREIAKRQPLRVVFRDSSFGTSPEKINVEEIFKLMSPKTTVKVI